MTPGPWRYDSGKIWTPNGWWVASVYEDMEEDIKRANGFLLAAAPEMLEALKLAAEINPFGSVENAAARDAARAAIAKARGEK